MTPPATPGPWPAAEPDARSEGPALLYRSMALEVLPRTEASADEQAAADDRIPVALSSEAPVERFDWYTGQRYMEVLDHAPDSVDLSYARDGMPFLREHDRRTHVGIIEDVTAGADRRLHGMLRLSRTQAGQDTRTDILDGILKKVSVGYVVQNQVLEARDEQAGDTYRVTRWTPMEGSGVAIPADYSVGLYRSANGAVVPVKLRAPERPLVGKEMVMGQETTPALQAAGDAVTAERTRQREIRAIAKLNEIASDRVERWIDEGITVDQMAREIVSERGKPVNEVAQSGTLDLSPKDRQPYSVGRAIKALASGNWKEAGYERAISGALSQRLGQEAQGCLMPVSHPLMGMRTPLTTTGATTGQKLVFTEPGSFIDFLRNRNMVLQMGTGFISGFRGILALPKQTAGGAASMVAENPGADYAEVNLTVDLVEWTPKSIAQTESYSKQVLANSIEAIDQLVTRDVFAGIATRLDFQVLHGDGLTNNIEGIYAKSGVNPVAFGGSVTYPKIVEMETAVEADNAAISEMGYLATPEAKGKAKTTAMFTNTSTPIWTGGLDGEMNGYRASATNQLLKNLGAGTNEHGLVFAAWGQGMIVDWGAVDLTVDIYSRARQGLINVTGLYLADWNTRHEESFAKATGLIP